MVITRLLVLFHQKIQKNTCRNAAVKHLSALSRKNGDHQCDRALITAEYLL